MFRLSNPLDFSVQSHKIQKNKKSKKNLYMLRVFELVGGPESPSKTDINSGVS